jgi:hypothetical protein
MASPRTIEVKSLFDSDTYHEMIARLNQLTPTSQRYWGKMSVSQMLAHCRAAFRVPLSDKPMPRLFLGRMIGWMIKKKLYDNVAWKHGLPTSPDFKIKDERDFETEKTGLISLVDEFYRRGPEGAGKYPHPMFGTYTSDQWGKCMWKHLDHHLRQFGV